MPLHSAIPSVHLLAVGRWHSSRWRKTRHTGMLSRNLVAHGKCLMNSAKLLEITCHMYLSSSHTTEVHKRQYKLFCERGGVQSTPSLWGLPLHGCTACKLLYQAAIWRSPCEDCLFMDALRANYYTRLRSGEVCRASHLLWTHVNPTDCGWMTDEDGKLAVTSCCYTATILPVCAVMQSPSVHLSQQWLGCTDMCRLQTYQSKASEEPVRLQVWCKWYWTVTCHNSIDKRSWHA
jgi:hypothetical protein